MGAYWAAFARDGVPSATGFPAWPKWGHADGSFLRLDSHSDGGIEVVQGADSLEAIATDLETDARVQPREVVEEMEKWMFGRPILGVFQAALGSDGAGL